MASTKHTIDSTDNMDTKRFKGKMTYTEASNFLESIGYKDSDNSSHYDDDSSEDLVGLVSKEYVSDPDSDSDSDSDSECSSLDGFCVKDSDTISVSGSDVSDGLGSVGSDDSDSSEDSDFSSDSGSDSEVEYASSSESDCYISDESEGDDYDNTE